MQCYTVIINKVPQVGGVFMWEELGEVGLLPHHERPTLALFVSTKQLNSSPAENYGFQANLALQYKVIFETVDSKYLKAGIISGYKF